MKELTFQYSYADSEPNAYFFHNRSRNVEDPLKTFLFEYEDFVEVYFNDYRNYWKWKLVFINDSIKTLFEIQFSDYCIGPVDNEVASGNWLRLPIKNILYVSRVS